MEKLKPCPFCGGVARFAKTFVMQSEERQIVYCGKCWARTASCDTQEEAADFWNTRVERSENERTD